MIYVADLNSTVHPISVGEGGGCVASTRSTVRCTIVMAIMHEYKKKCILWQRDLIKPPMHTFLLNDENITDVIVLLNKTGDVWYMYVCVQNLQ